MTLYEYVGANPVGRIDPTGLSEEDAGTGDGTVSWDDWNNNGEDAGNSNGQSSEPNPGSQPASGTGRLSLTGQPVGTAPVAPDGSLIDTSPYTLQVTPVPTTSLSTFNFPPSLSPEARAALENQMGAMRGQTQVQVPVNPPQDLTPSAPYNATYDLNDPAFDPSVWNAVQARKVQDIIPSAMGTELTFSAYFFGGAQIGINAHLDAANLDNTGIYLTIGPGVGTPALGGSAVLYVAKGTEGNPWGGPFLTAQGSEGPISSEGFTNLDGSIKGFGLGVGASFPTVFSYNVSRVRYIPLIGGQIGD
jgi:hypothetical protein